VTHILIDVDGPLHDVEWRCQQLVRLGVIRVRMIRYDRTAHGWHVIVDVPGRRSSLEVVALQAIIGSDWKREAFNLMRVKNLDGVPLYWRQRWNVLYSRHSRGIKI